MNNSYLIDTHTHINFNAFQEDAEEVIQRALDNKIQIIVVGVQYSTSLRAIKYAQNYPEKIYAAVGLHPNQIKGVFEDSGLNGSKELEVFDKEKYKDLLQMPSVVAMGEIGLDYYHIERTKAKKDIQKEVFRKQIELAIAADKPIIIHCRKAYDDLIEILTNYNSINGVVHSFTGNKKQAKKLIEMGFYLGFNGLITYTSGLEVIVKQTPLEKILLETDSPLLAPIPHRGERNEPAYVRYVAEKIADIKNLSEKDIAYQTTQNACHLFRL